MCCLVITNSIISFCLFTNTVGHADASNIRDQFQDSKQHKLLQLRSRIPTQPSDVKLTKVETLRLAMSYIMHLEKLVGDIKAQEKETGSSEVSSTSETKSSRVSVLTDLFCFSFKEICAKHTFCAYIYGFLEAI